MGRRTLVGKLRALVDHESPEAEPLDATHEDVQTFEGMIADEPIMREPRYQHVSGQIEKAILGQPG